MRAASAHIMPMRRRVRRALALATAIVSVSTAVAVADERVTVRAGEHGDYSRLVVSAPSIEGWRAVNTGRTVELVLTGDGYELEASAVAPRRMAHRVVSAEARAEDGGTRLVFGLNCDCVSSASPLGQNRIVLDIRDGAVSQTTTSRQEPSTAEDAPANAQTTEAPALDPADQITRAREILLQQLQRAADEGLISFGAPTAQSEADIAAAPSDQAATLAAPSTIEAEPAVADSPVDLATEIDAPAPTIAAPAAAQPSAALVSPLSAALNAAPDAPAAVECRPDVQLDPTKWRGRRTFFEELSLRRGRIYTDLNLIAPDAVADVARLYLSHGLGLEAAATPRIFGVDTDETQFLGHLADVVIGHAPRANSPFAAGAECDGRHAIWRAAALWRTDPSASLAAYEAADDALTSFRAPHRRLFGGRIGRAAIAAGDIATAEAILQILRRNSAPATNDMLWIEAEVEIAEGSMRRARRALRQMIQERGPEAPFAVIRLAETYGPADNQADVDEVVATLQEFALQYRGAQVGAEAVAGEAALLARFGEVSDAAALLDRTAFHEPDYAPYLAARRLALIEAEISAAISDPTPERMSAAIQAAGLIDIGKFAAQDGPSADTLRIALAETLLANGAAALAPLALPPHVAARSETAEALLAEAAAAEALLPAAIDGPTEDAPIRALLDTTAPEIEPTRPVESGRALVETLDAELRLMREIARDE